MDALPVATCSTTMPAVVSEAVTESAMDWSSSTNSTFTPSIVPLSSQFTRNSLIFVKFGRFLDVATPSVVWLTVR